MVLLVPSGIISKIKCTKTVQRLAVWCGKWNHTVR